MSTPQDRADACVKFCAGVPTERLERTTLEEVLLAYDACHDYWRSDVIDRREGTSIYEMCLAEMNLMGRPLRLLREE